MINLDAGELRHRITVQSVSKTSDGEGGFSEVWADEGTYWASIKQLRAKQIGELRSINVHATHLVKVRANVEVEEGQKIIFGTREFEILTIDNEKEQNVTKWLTCKEVRN